MHTFAEWRLFSDDSFGFFFRMHFVVVDATRLVALVHRKTLKILVIQLNVLCRRMGVNTTLFYSSLIVSHCTVNSMCNRDCDARSTICEWRMWTTICLHSFSSDSWIFGCLFSYVFSANALIANWICSSDGKTIACESHIQYLLISFCECVVKIFRTKHQMIRQCPQWWPNDKYFVSWIYAFSRARVISNAIYTNRKWTNIHRRYRQSQSENGPQKKAIRFDVELSGKWLISLDSDTVGKKTAPILTPIPKTSVLFFSLSRPGHRLNRFLYFSRLFISETSQSCVCVCSRIWRGRRWHYLMEKNDSAASIASTPNEWW